MERWRAKIVGMWEKKKQYQKQGLEGRLWRRNDGALYAPSSCGEYVFLQPGPFLSRKLRSYYSNNSKTCAFIAVEGSTRVDLLPSMAAASDL